MQHKQVINELDYHQAQKITELLYHMNLITFAEYDKLTQKNRRTFSPVLVDLLPNPKKETLGADSTNSSEWREAV